MSNQFITILALSKMINPFTDEGFKRLFGREESKPAKIELLNTVLADESKRVVYSD